MKRACSILTILLWSFTVLQAQRSDLHLRRSTVDAAGTLTVSLTRFTKGTAEQTPIDTAGCVVSVDGTVVQVENIDCQTSGSTEDLSSVLTIDVSGSMAKGGPNIVLARSAAQAWVRALSSGSECAITAFDHSASLIHDFSADTTSLLRSIDRLSPRGGTDYDAGMLTDELGGIPMAATGRNRRVLVFLTDGIGRATTARMMAEAQAAGVTVYCVTLGMPMPESLRLLCEATGGLWFDNVTTIDQARMAYQRIHAAATAPQACELRVTLPPSCTRDRALEIRVGDDTVRTTVRMLESSTSFASVHPRSLRLDAAEGRTSTTIRAGTLPVTITGIDVTCIGTVRLTIDGTEPTFPVRIDPNDSVTIDVDARFRDTLYTVCRIDIRALPCPLPSVYLSHGPSSSRPARPTIRVVSPNGGERFASRTKTALRYDGVPEDLPVKVETSYDLGRTWTLVGNDLTGHSIPWTAPPITSDSCLLRVSQVMPEAVRIQPLMTINGVRVEQFQYLSSGSFLASAALVRGTNNSKIDSVVRIHRASDGTVLHTFPGIRFVEVDRGRTIITWDLGGTLRGYDVASGRALWTTPIAPSSQLIGVFPDGEGQRALVVGGWDDRPRVIDCTSGLTVARMPLSHRDVEASIMSPTGNVVAFCRPDSSIHVYDARTAAERYRLRAPGVATFYRGTISPDGSALVATANTGTAHVWSLDDGRLTQTLAKRQYVNDNAYVTFLPDGRRVVLETGKDQTSIVDIRTAENVVTMQRTPGVGGVMTAKPSRDGSLVALSSLGRVTVHETASGVMMYEMRQVDYQPSISPDGTRIALRVAEGEAGIYDMGPRILQADTSDAPWAIYQTNARLRDIRFLPLPVGQSADSLLRGGIRNPSSDTVWVESIRIEGAEAKNFDVRTAPGFMILPGDSADIEYAFTPRVTGERAAMIIAEVTGGLLRARISGPARGSLLTAEADLLNCGAVDVGETREVATDQLLINTGKQPVVVRSVRVVEDQDRAFELVSERNFTIQPGEKHDLILRFTARREGRMTARLAFEIEGYTETLYATLYGRGDVDTFRVAKSDPTTFRGILLPTSIIPPKGTIVTGVYDVLGLTGGYALTDHVMVLGGGVLPLPNRWFGASGYDASWSAAWSIGAKAAGRVNETTTIGGGYQMGMSYYDQDVTEEIESRITFNALWASAGFGTDDRRLNLTLGYAFKWHERPYEGSFQADATIIGVAYDHRISYDWKICGEAFFMRTMTFVPVTITARYFDAVQAFDVGFTVTGIPASGADASAWPVIPMISWVRRW